MDKWNTENIHTVAHRQAQYFMDKCGVHYRLAHAVTTFTYTETHLQCKNKSIKVTKPQIFRSEESGTVVMRLIFDMGCTGFLSLPERL